MLQDNFQPHLSLSHSGGSTIHRFSYVASHNKTAINNPPLQAQLLTQGIYIEHQNITHKKLTP